MISLEKLKILAPSQKMPKNVGDLGKLLVATGFEKLPKVQSFAQSGDTDNSFNVAHLVTLGTALFVLKIV